MKPGVNPGLIQLHRGRGREKKHCGDWSSKLPESLYKRPEICRKWESARVACNAERFGACRYKGRWKNVGKMKVAGSIKEQRFGGLRDDSCEAA